MSNNLKKIRLERNMTQKEFAKILGYTVEHYNKVENETFGKKLPVQRAARLARKLGITLDEIFLSEN